MIKRFMLSMLVALVGLGAKANDFNFTIPVGFSKYHYATFSKPTSYNGQRFEYINYVEIPEGVTAYKMLGEYGDIYDIQTNNNIVEFKLKLVEIPLTNGRQITSNDYPSMILYSEELKSYDITVCVEAQVRPRKAAGESSTFGCYSFDNMLIPGVAGLTTEEVMANMEIADEVTELDNKLREGTPATRANDSEYYYYKLTTKVGTNFGFYWGAEDGAYFETKANKAYLAILKSLFTNPQTSGAKTRVRLIDETGFLSADAATGIELIPVGDAPEVEIEEADTYDLLGRKVTTTIPGRIYIKNGKKYIK